MKIILEASNVKTVQDKDAVKVDLEDPNSVGVEDYKLVEPIPSEVRNFLTSGHCSKFYSWQIQIV